MSFVTTIYLVWIGIVIRRVMLRALPRPSDIVLLSLFFYNAPLALAALLSSSEWLSNYPLFLNVAAGDASLAEQTLLLTVIASIAVCAGRQIAASLKKQRREWVVPASLSLQRVSARFCLGSVMVIFMGIALFGASTFFAGYAVESESGLATEGVALVFFAYEAIGICCFMWICARNHTRRTDGRVWIVFALACLLGITATRGKRLEFIIALLPLFLWIWSTVLTRPRYRLLYAAVLVLFISAMASFRQGELPDAASLAFNVFSEGLYAGHVTPGVLEAVKQAGLPMENGMRYLAAIGAFMPRFLFPNKDELIYKSLTDLTQFAPLGATSILAEAYLQGGVFATAAWFAFVGFLGGRIEILRLVSNSSFVTIRTVLYVLFVCSFVPHFRDGLIPSIKIPLQLLSVLMIVVALAVGRLALKQNTSCRPNPSPRAAWCRSIASEDPPEQCASPVSRPS